MLIILMLFTGRWRILIKIFYIDSHQTVNIDNIKNSLIFNFSAFYIYLILYIILLILILLYLKIQYEIQTANPSFGITFISSHKLICYSVSLKCSKRKTFCIIHTNQYFTDDYQIYKHRCFWCLIRRGALPLWIHG